VTSRPGAGWSRPRIARRICSGVLPQFPWVAQRLRDTGLPNDLVGELLVGQVGDLDNKILAIALVERGVILSDVLQPTSAEERVVQVVFDWVADLAFMNVVAVHEAAMWTERAMPLVQAGFGATASLFRVADVCAARLDSCLFRTVIGVRRGVDIIHSWGLTDARQPYVCLSLPAPIAMLVAKGKWRSVPWHPQWRADVKLVALLAGLKRRQASRLFPRADTAVATTSASWRQLADELQEHWPALEAAARADHCDGDAGNCESGVLQARLQLSSQVIRLRQLAEVFSCSHTLRGGRVYNAGMVINSSLLSSLLRDADDLKRSMQIALRIACPSLADSWDEMLNQTRIPAKSTISKWAMRVDVAYMSMVRKKKSTMSHWPRPRRFRGGSWARASRGWGFIALLPQTRRRSVAARFSFWRAT